MKQLLRTIGFILIAPSFILALILFVFRIIWVLIFELAWSLSTLWLNKDLDTINDFIKKQTLK